MFVGSTSRTGSCPPKDKPPYLREKTHAQHPHQPHRRKDKDTVGGYLCSFTQYLLFKLRNKDRNFIPAGSLLCILAEFSTYLALMRSG